MSEGLKKKFAEFERQAKEECTSGVTTAHHAGAPGRPFWNYGASQFMFVPSFQFSLIPGCRRYLFTATDENEKVYSFEAETSRALLTPIWKDLPEGVVRLSVSSLDEDPKKCYPVGARTFFKLSPFSTGLPSAVQSYRQCAKRAFDFAMAQGFVSYWLEHGVPDPSYDLNIYPSKMISSLINAMLAFSEISPESEKEAVGTARAAADFLLSITPGKDAPLPEIPPTYYLDFCPDPVKYGIYTENWQAASLHKGTVMMIYPAQAGESLVKLSLATGEKKYLSAAEGIGRFYAAHQELNGSWRLMWSEETGEPISDNYVDPLFTVVPFLTALYEATGETLWKDIADRAIGYVENTVLSSYNWEGQFEDTPLSSNYSNLTHYGASALIHYYTGFRRDDPVCMEKAADLMRYVEDQFVVWKRPAPWVGKGYDTKLWHTPAGLEQYSWYVPIDASTVDVARTFLSMYKAGQGDIYLAKAMTLVDQVTIVQHENGQIDTHWADCDAARENFWMNCLFDAAETLVLMAEYDENREKYFCGN